MPDGCDPTTNGSAPNAPIKLSNKTSKRKEKVLKVEKQIVKKESQISRSRNWTSIEISVLVKEVADQLKVLKGRHGPGVTNQKKELVWKLLASRINAVNGHNDRTWEQCRRKFQDLESSARTKARAHDIERKNKTNI